VSALRCPGCRAPLVAARDDRPVTCASCTGTWYPVRAIRAVLPAADAFVDALQSADDRESTRLCARCDGVPLRLVAYEGHELDRCARCNGVFFDGDEVARVRLALRDTDARAAHAGNVRDAKDSGMFWGVEAAVDVLVGFLDIN
jgi:LSD1 subclass zinc finger protein